CDDNPEFDCRATAAALGTSAVVDKSEFKRLRHTSEVTLARSSTSTSVALSGDLSITVIATRTAALPASSTHGCSADAQTICASCIAARSNPSRLWLCVIVFVDINPARSDLPMAISSEARDHQHMTKSALSGPSGYAARSASTYPSPNASLCRPRPIYGGFP